MIENLIKGIEVSKNLLDTLPKNNIKNRNKYKLALEETKNTYSNIFAKVEKEINKRYSKYTDINEEQTLDIQLDRINFIKSKLFLLNNYNSAYEKFNFDKILYQLNHFYKSDLNEANKNIISCVKLFKMVGIDLKPEHFNYSEFAHEYMRVLLTNPSDTEKVKETFEKIYWQCSDLLIHIELNIKYLFYNNKNSFEKYANQEKNKFLKLFAEEPLNYYKNLVIDYDDHKSCSLERGLKKFLNKEWNINDYQNTKIEKYYSFFTGETPTEEVNEEIRKLSNSASEYKNYLSFKYIIDDIKEKYLQTNNQKNELKNITKDIAKKEKLIHKYTKKKNKKERINTKIMQLINELEMLYERLDEVTFNERLSKNISSDSSLYDALAIACSHYSYIVKCIKKSELSEDFDKEQQRLINFLLNPYNNVIMNIAISEDKDLALIISDRYKLSNFNINKETLTSNSNIDEIVNNASKIDVYSKIVSKLSYERLKFIENTKEMLKK